MPIGTHHDHPPVPKTADKWRVRLPQRYGTGHALAGPVRRDVRGSDIERAQPTGKGPSGCVPGEVLDPRGRCHELRLLACRPQAGLFGHLLVTELKLIEPGVDAISRK